MNALYDWHLMRGLVTLLILGLFILLAVATGLWQSRNARRQPRREEAPADSPLAEPATIGTRDRVAADRRPAGREVRSVAAPERRAA